VDPVATRTQGGFTLIETMIVVAIVAVLAALSVPSLQQWNQNQRAKSTIRLVASSLIRARSEAIRTGNNHIVFLQGDALGNPLLDSEGTAVPVMVINDDQPGAANQNCRIDAGETVSVVYAESGLNWGVTAASAAAPNDSSGGAIASGSSFVEPDGDPATWVLFRPDGRPVAFAPDCSMGGVGSGVGGVYITNGKRDYAVVVTALGGIRVHAWNNAAGQWTN
jgi:prepilin-type N-terminal cleavage/methylation domain-containing protein